MEGTITKVNMKKLDKLAEELEGEFGFETCDEEGKQRVLDAYTKKITYCGVCGGDASICDGC